MTLRQLVPLLRAAGARRALGEGLAGNPGAPLLESLPPELGP